MLLGYSAVTEVAAPLFSPLGLPGQRRQGETSVNRKGRELGGHSDKPLVALSCHAVGAARRSVVLLCVPLRWTILTHWLCISDHLDHKCQLFAFNQHILPATASSLLLVPVSYSLDPSSAKSR